MKSKPFSTIILNFETFRKLFMVFRKGFAPEPAIWPREGILKIWDHKIWDKGWNFFSIGNLFEKCFSRFFTGFLLPHGLDSRHGACPVKTPLSQKQRNKIAAKIVKKRFCKSFPMEKKFQPLSQILWSQIFKIYSLSQITGSGAKPLQKTIKSFRKISKFSSVVEKGLVFVFWKFQSISSSRHDLTGQQKVPKKIDY